MSRKLSYEEYLDWHRDTLAEDLRHPDLETKFTANTGVLVSTANAHKFLSILTTRLADLAGNGVFQNSAKAPDLLLYQKPLGSLINKLYRQNCLWNRSWSEPPKGGWITYQNCFTRIDDLIRTTLVCKYVDGPEIVATAIKEAAREAGLTARAGPRATDAGYYAWHTYVSIPARVIVADQVVEVLFQVEFQMPTLLQSVLRELTHRFYEQSRAAPAGDKTELRWDYDSHRFRAEYLGHTLHLVDAMVLELREAQTLPEGVSTSEGAAEAGSLGAVASGDGDYIKGGGEKAAPEGGAENAAQ
jgi:ppGpp synthetase/RelA/SpoT-type nucleotidyltranferase